MTSGPTSAKKSVSPELKLLRAADRNFTSANILDNYPQCKLTAYMLYAFACELYLKCLITIEGKKPPETHNLRQLFFELAPENQKLIRREWKEFVKKDRGMAQLIKAAKHHFGITLTFDEALKLSQKAFELLRYYWDTEATQTVHGWYATQIIVCIRNRIIDVSDIGEPVERQKIPLLTK